MSKSLYKVLVAPRVSEKSMGLADKSRQHVFEVNPFATKKAVQAAVELMFDVEVENVNILNVKGKRKGRGPHQGQRKNWKKAYIQLKPGFDIQLGGE